MNVVFLYLILLKATITSFSAYSALPLLREDLVVEAQVLTDEQLNTAVAVGRTAPGPMGAYVVSIGYYVAGYPGAVAGWLAMITPALIVIPLLVSTRKLTRFRRIRGVLSAILLSSAGLIVTSTIPMATASVTDWKLLSILVASLLISLYTRLDTVWVLFGGAAVYLIL